MSGRQLLVLGAAIAYVAFAYGYRLGRMAELEAAFHHLHAETFG